jgi:hypothetical protein
VALGGFVQPSFRFQLSAFSISASAQLWLWVASRNLLSDFSISAFAQLWLCAALFLISAFSFQHFSFCPIVALGWLARPVTNHESRITNHESPPALGGSE